MDSQAKCEEIILTKVCSKCGEKKNVKEFYKKKSNKDGLAGRCRACIKEYHREYRQRPEVKEHRREYYQRPEVKEHRREYGQRPEVKEHRREYQREYDREYYQRPEVKERKREYHREYAREYGQRPEVKEHRREYHREYDREYGQRPEVKERKREYGQRIIRNFDDTYICKLIKNSLGINPYIASEKEKQTIINIYGSVENCIKFYKKNLKLKRIINSNIQEGMKKCYLCGKIKILNEFCKNKHKKDGYGYMCKQCWKEYNERRKK